MSRTTGQNKVRLLNDVTYKYKKKGISENVTVFLLTLIIIGAVTIISEVIIPMVIK